MMKHLMIIGFLLLLLGAPLPSMPLTGGTWPADSTALPARDQTSFLLLWKEAKRSGGSAVASAAAQIFNTTDAHLNRIVGRYYQDTLGDHAQAVKFLEHAYELCTKEHALNTLIAGPSVPPDKLEAAAASYRAVVANDLGMLLFEDKEYEKAEMYLRVASAGTKDVQLPRATFLLGDLYLLQGKSDLAAEALARGLAADDNPDAMQKLVALTGSRENARAKIRSTRAQTASTAINFSLLSLDGDSVSLSRLRGKVVVVDFWATWCGPCQHEMPYLQKLVRKYAGQADLVFLSISTDQNRAVVKPFIDRNKYEMKVLYNDGTDQAYGVTGIPSLVLIDRDGKIQFKHVGFGGDGEAFVSSLSEEIDGLLAHAAGEKP